MDTQDIFRRVESQYEREKNASRKVVAEVPTAVATIDSDLANLLGLEVEASGATPDTEQQFTPGEFPDRFVSNFFSEWTSAVLEKAAQGNVDAYLHLDREILTRLLHELERAAQRTGLVDHLKQVMKVNYQYKSSSSKSWMLQQTAILTGLFNQFVVRGGCSAETEMKAFQIDTLDGKKQVVFSSHPEVNGIEIPDIAEDFSKTYFIDWLQAIQFTIRANAEFVAQESGDTPSNRELGELLRQLSATTELVI